MSKSLLITHILYQIPRFLQFLTGTNLHYKPTRLCCLKGQGREKGVPLLYPCSPGTWVLCSTPKKSPTAFPLPSTNLFSKRLQNHREHWGTSERSDLCGWVGTEMEVSYPRKQLRMEMITLSCFLMLLVFRWPTLLKILPGKCGNIPYTFPQLPLPNLFDGTSSCQQILIKRPFPAFKTAVLPGIKVWFQLIMPVLHFSPFGCTFPCLPSVTGYPARRISSAMPWTQWDDDDRIKGPHGDSAQTQNYSDQPECTNSFCGNCKEPAENEVTWKIYTGENLDRWKLSQESWIVPETCRWRRRKRGRFH